MSWSTSSIARPWSSDRAQPVAELAALGGVESRCGLVEAHHLRLRRRALCATPTSLRWPWLSPIGGMVRHSPPARPLPSTRSAAVLPPPPGASPQLPQVLLPPRVRRRNPQVLTHRQIVEQLGGLPSPSRARGALADAARAEAMSSPPSITVPRTSA